jgi:hypothetical protein
MEDYGYSIDNDYNGVSYIELTDALQDYLYTLYGEDFNYYAAYAKVTDVTSTKTRLENEYKPYGQMLPRSNFPNQSAYDAYVETFLSKTYPFASTLKENALDVLISRLNFDIEHFREVQSNRQHNTFLLYSSIFTFLFFLISYLLYVYFKQLSFSIFKRLNIAFLFLAFFLLSSVLGILLNQGSLDLFLSVLPWMWTTILPALFYLSIFAFSYFQTLPSQKVNPVHSKTHKKKDENFTSHDSLKGPNTPHEE